MTYLSRGAADNTGLMSVAYDQFVSRCDRTLHQVFGIAGSQSVELRAWLYDIAVDTDAMADTMHTEPLYLVAEFLGIDAASPDFAKSEHAYGRAETRDSPQYRAA